MGLLLGLSHHCKLYMSCQMMDQRAAVVKVERENGLLFNEALWCAAQLPEAVRDAAVQKLEKRREAFQQCIDGLYGTLHQDSRSGASTEMKQILEQLAKVDRDNQERPAATVAEMGRLTERLAKLEREKLERPTASSAEISRMAERLAKLERENQELRQRWASPPPRVAAAAAEPEGEEVVMNDKFATGITLAFSGGLAQEGGKIVKKEDGLERWDAGGLCSFPKIEAGKRQGFQFQPCQCHLSFTVGLQHCLGLPSPPHSMGELELAVHCAKDSTLEILTRGERVAQCGKYRPSSIVELSISEAAEVGLFVDGEFLFRLAKPPRFPLYVATSFFSPGAALRGLSWTEGTPFAGEPERPPIPNGARGPVNFVGLCNGLEQLAPGHLKKTGGVQNNWNATAVSSESLMVGQGRGLRFWPGATNMHFMIGLGGQSSAPADHIGMDYAAYCSGNGSFFVQENGVFKFNRCPYSSTSIVELRVSETQVEVVLDGAVKYTGQLRGQRALYAMASFNSIGAEALEIQWL